MRRFKPNNDQSHICTECERHVLTPGKSHHYCHVQATNRKFACYVDYELIGYADTDLRADELINEHVYKQLSKARKVA